MDASAKKFKPSSVASARVRGVILSPHGWQRFQVAKQQAESEETWGKRFTQEYLNECTGLSLNTLTRIFKRELGVDRQSLELLFQAFGLELTKADYASPRTLESQRENPQQDWDNAVDASIFYGREAELAQLWQWIVSERCRMVGLLGIGGIGKSTIAVKVALQMQTEFEIMVWRSLANAPSLDDNYQIPETAQLDELKTFVCKKNKIWLWTVVNTKLPGIIKFVVGERSLVTFQLLWQVVAR